MKKILFAAIALLGLAASAQAAPIWGTVQIGTTTALVPTLQNGGINISSGNVRNLTVSTATINRETVVQSTITNLTTANVVFSSGFSIAVATATNLTSTNFNTSTGSISNFTAVQSTSTNLNYTNGIGTNLTLGAITFTQSQSSGTFSDFTMARSTAASMVVSSLTITGPLKAGIGGLTSGTSTQVLVSAGPGLPPFFAGGRILQAISTSTSISRTSTSASYADTGLQYSFTPLSANSRIFIWVYQAMSANISANEADCTFRMQRDAGSIGPQGDLRGLDANIGSGTFSEQTMSGLAMNEASPGTSAVVYKTSFSRFAGAGTCGVQLLNNSLSATSSMSIMEVGQ